jgi:hypothetical protein
MHDENPELKLAYGFLQDTGENVFLTGKAGTGKTTFLHNFKKSSPKRTIVLAPTGVAAINAGGVTIHSFFQLPFGPQIPGAKREAGASAGNYHKLSRDKLNIIKSMDLLIIDEISMVRADLLDGVDQVLRKFRDHNKPFGGVQLLLIGDIHQLAPVVKDDEWEILRSYYETPYFFGSKALKQSNYITIELKRVYRQSDQDFINILNKIRDSEADSSVLGLLNKRYCGGFSVDSDGAIILTTHNFQAQKINEQKMKQLSTKPVIFTARIEGEFPEYSYPADNHLTLKVGAQVMFIKNDSSAEKRYFNGKIGVVQSIEDDVVKVVCQGEKSAIDVETETWQNMKYCLNKETGAIEEAVIGTFTQYPLRAAWAITIHKSQGLTFDKVFVDAAAAFAHGQVYVALSRCRTLEGLTLTSPLSRRVLISDKSVSEFNKKADENKPDENILFRTRITYQQTLVRELFDFSPIKRGLGYILKIMNENKMSIHSSIMEKFESINKEFHCSIVNVTEKFNLQITQYLSKGEDVEKNEPLQERIKKGALYFKEKIQSCMIDLLPGKIDIDNKEVRKSLEDALKRLNDDIKRKTACLETCKEGFSTKAYLQARAMASIEKPAAMKKDFDFDEESGAEEHPGLYRMLKSWRNEKARQIDLPHYMVLPYKVMADICSRLPESMSELKSIKGMGKKKLNNYGADLLEIVGQYRKENGICTDKKKSAIKKVSPSALKGSTKQISYDLFKTGKTTAEIASQRGLALSTIEGHLSYFIGTGQLDIHEFISAEKLSEMSEFFEKQDSFELTPAKEFFGERYTYSELRMVAEFIKRKKELKKEVIEETSENRMTQDL